MEPSVVVGVQGGKEGFPEQHTWLTATSCKRAGHQWENMPKSYRLYACSSMGTFGQRRSTPSMYDQLQPAFCLVLEEGPLMEFKVCECLSKASRYTGDFTSHIHRVAMIQGCGL